MRYTTVEGDVLDLICFRFYGREGTVEQVLDANPLLANHPVIFDTGVVIQLPDIEINQKVNQVSLWD